jgi:outer membrane receptor protein involved in Fe transport
LTFVSTLLLTTALAAPAFAQIEEVVVTAQKRAEDIQTVPIAVTAYTAQDLKDRQITKFNDLQFATPNVTYSQANFGGANFQIRGLGVTAVGGGSESGVAINFADVFLASPPTDGASFFDLQDLEVLRGPQSTLYGRGATGGVVNIQPRKPDLEDFSSYIDVSYGNYNGAEATGAINIPIVTDQLGIRIAGDWIRHDGFTTNDYDDSHQNGREQYSFRGSVLWEPTSSTSISLVGQIFNEDDDRARADKQFCNPDPTGVLGCTPGKAETGAINLNATYLNNFASSEAIAGAFGPGFALKTVEGLGTPEALTFAGTATGLIPGTAGTNVANLLATYAAGTPAQQAVAGTYNLYAGLGGALAGGLGLTHLSTAYVPPPNANPSNLWHVNDDFNPVNKQADNFLSLEVKQGLTDWLDVTLVGGYDHGSYFNQQSYTNTLGPTINPAALAAAEGTFNFLVGTPGLLGPNGSPALAASYAPFFAQAGQLPVSNFKNLGISSQDINRFTNLLSANDQTSGESTEESFEFRFNSKFQGPVNFMVGGYYLQHHENEDYYVGSNSLDYASILLGGVTAAEAPLGTPALLIGPSYYDDEERNVDLKSESAFAEVYYDIVPDLLKLTVGGRYNEDWKSEDTRIPILAGAIPLGASNYDASVTAAGTPFTANAGKFDSTTGRVVLDYTPKLDFTDQTLFYASYAHGYKAGGFNPGIQANGGSAGLTDEYGPEKIDAFELGTKNILLNGSLQANGDIWYYDYTGLQVSSIIGNTSINENIDAKLYGVEGEFVWLATDKLQFSLNIADTHSGIGSGVNEVDERNPTGGDPRAILVKDDTLTGNGAGNCVIYDLNPGHAKPQLPSGFTLIPAAGIGYAEAQYTAPPGGAYALTGSGVAAAAYGSCSSSPQLAAFLAAQGYGESDPNVKGSSMTGVPVSLKGHELQQTPNLTFSVGAQYTFDLDSGYTLVPRVDYYWQSHTWGRIFHDPADFINSWDVVNGQITLNSPDKDWYVGAYVKNAFNKTYVTGQYLTSASSGLYTNAFLGDPRTYGVNAGIKF